MTLLDKARQLFRTPVVAHAAPSTVPARQVGWSAAIPAAATAQVQRTAPPPPAPVQNSVPSGDQAAIERYRYRLRTSPPQQLEQVHAAAFAKLAPAQRRQVLLGLAPEVPVGERIAAADDPQSLARLATRAEVRQTGTLERVFGAAGGTFPGGLLAGVAAAVVGSVPVDGLLDTGSADPGLLDLGGRADRSGSGGASDL